MGEEMLSAQLDYYRVYNIVYLQIWSVRDIDIIRYSELVLVIDGVE
jgi:hypothetical protein